jgi:hypothetical protein
MRVRPSWSTSRATKPGSKRVERDEAGNIVRVVDEVDELCTEPCIVVMLR